MSIEVIKPLFSYGGPLYYPGLKVLLPQGDSRPITCINNMNKTSWFDVNYQETQWDSSTLRLVQENKISELFKTIYSRHSQVEIELSSIYQLQLAKQEASLLKNDFSKVMIGGFSQGCIISLASLVRHQGPSLGGVLCLSGMMAYDFRGRQ